jgi:uridine kinase
MKGDVVLVEEHHRRAGEVIAAALGPRIGRGQGRFVITVAGESGSGKSETAAAIRDALTARGTGAAVLGQDDHFVLPPRSNDQKRRQDPEWLGPHCEIRFDLLQANVDEAAGGAERITQPSIDYDADAVTSQILELAAVAVVIVEGTYVSLLKRVDARVFIARSRHDTLVHRAKRNRGNEVGDPFVEGILAVEHKIIAGHRHLADFLITRSYDVVPLR